MQRSKKNTTSSKKNTSRWAKLVTLPILIVASVILVGGAAAPTVLADRLNDQIQALKEENARNRAAVADLAATATSYQSAIHQLEGQISQLQGQINENAARQADLQAKIEEGQRELERQREVLGSNVKMMYLEGDISTIEILANSKNLSDFVDKEEYRTAVQNKIQDTLKKIAKLQAEQKDQKAQVEELLKQQREQQSTLNGKRAEQSRMLSLNKQQQSDFNRKTSANQSKIDDLIAQQRRANQGAKGGYYFIRVPGNVGSHDITNDDYPYKNAGFSMALAPCSHTDNLPDSPDRWGYCTRQCVSYAAWAVERSGRPAPMYYGSAKDWIDSAPASWIHRDPKPGDVAITTSGTWGHAMYVEDVDGDRIYVSQYNNELTGKYSTQWRTFR